MAGCSKMTQSLRPNFCPEWLAQCMQYSRLMGELESDGLLKDDSDPSSLADGLQDAPPSSRKDSEGAETSNSGAGAFIGPQPMVESARKVEEDTPALEGDAAGASP